MVSPVLCPTATASFRQCFCDLTLYDEHTAPRPRRRDSPTAISLRPAVFRAASVRRISPSPRRSGNIADGERQTRWIFDDKPRPMPASGSRQDPSPTPRGSESVLGPVGAHPLRSTSSCPQYFRRPSLRTTCTSNSGRTTPRLYLSGLPSTKAKACTLILRRGDERPPIFSSPPTAKPFGTEWALHLWRPVTSKRPPSNWGPSPCAPPQRQMADRPGLSMISSITAKKSRKF